MLDPICIRPPAEHHHVTKHWLLRSGFMGVSWVQAAWMPERDMWLVERREVPASALRRSGWSYAGPVLAPPHAGPGSATATRRAAANRPADRLSVWSSPSLTVTGV